MAQEQSDVKFDFLRSFIEKTLEGAGLESLTEETKDQYLPQFVAEAERRVGLALIPELDPSAAGELKKVFELPEPDPEAIRNFWKTHVSNFDEIVKKTLEDFAVELKQTLSQIS
ncbi:hypothetical protein HOF40_01605 [Candidatus Parcubacteria bacterium]|jgi:hypothetical protein|nr:hypothetical protein [Candidatus Parcubacteria bacterium]MBT3948761.1 hypothetical protein [Candidatus Parcubacteria bacterium]